jgi:hypothetical protein
MRYELTRKEREENLDALNHACMPELEDIRLNEEQSRELLTTADSEPPDWLKRAAARSRGAESEATDGE